MRINEVGNVGIGTINPVEKLMIVSDTSGYTGGIVNSNTQSGSYLRIAPLGTNTGVTQWATSSVVFEGLPASSGNTILGSYNSGLVFQTGIRTDRMRLLADGTLIHNGFALPSSPGAIGAISFVPSSVNPIYNRIVFGADGSGYGLAIASQDKTSNVVTDRLVIYDNGRINIPGATASTSTTTGALTVAGGVGIAGALITGATATFAGNVGIGTTNPNSLLNLSASNAVLNIENTLANGGSGSVLRFGHNQNSDRRPVAEIKTILTDGSATRSGHLAISTSLSGTLTERMRIETGGNVGIGTTTPQAKFVVSSGGAEGVEFLPGHFGNGSIIQGVNRSVGGYTTLRFDAYNFIFNTTPNAFLINSSGQANIPTPVQSTSVNTGGLTLGGGLGMALNLTVGGGISAVGGITTVGNLNVGDPRNYTTSGALHSSGYMMCALGSHTNTKIQLVCTGNSENFGGNSDTDGGSLLMWAGEPSLTYSGSGIGSNMTCSPLTTDNRQFTGQGQAFIRFTSDGSMGFHTAPVGTLILPTTPRVSISPAGALNAGTLNVSSLSKLERLAVFNGSDDINGACRISAKASAADTAAIIGYANNASVYAILGYQNTYSFDGVGTFRHNGLLTNTGAITATTTITPGDWTNGSAPKSYIGTAAPILANFPVSGSIWFVV